MHPHLPKALAAVWLLGASASHAAELFVGELPPIVVTPSSVDGSAFTVPHGLSVITAADIAKATVSNLGELLSREAGLTLKSFSGSDKNASIDIRGMGDTAVSNVLVMVDGVRLNESDLSGADLSSIALSEIDRIEIVRGGGAVRYGDGAVGGVINILTRQPATGSVHGSVQADAGSYGAQGLRASLSGGRGDWSARATASRALRDGYRENSAFNRSDGSLEVRYATALASFSPELFARLSVHQDTYGLPGPVSAADFVGSASQRRDSNAPFDGGSTDDRTLTVGANLDFGTAGLLEFLLNRRDRDNPYIIGYTPLLSRADQASRIESNRQEMQLRYSLDFDALGHTHSLDMGVHRQTADYLRGENGTDGRGCSTRRSGNIEGTGAYAETTLRGPGGLALNAGVRANRLASDYRDEKYDQVCVSYFPPSGCVQGYLPQNASRNTWNNQAYELGLTWEASPSQVFFASGSRHFRAPNIDELALAAADLRPQHGVTAEVGMRLKPGSGTELSATLFGMRIQDEIYYGQDPTTGASLNRNYDAPTRRLGGELQGRWRLAASLTLNANLAYVQPRFEGTDADVPHVPRWTANAHLEWHARDALRLFATARHVGARYDGNDLTNRDFPVLPTYTVYDLAARYVLRDIEITAAVNNLFDKVYSTVGYSATYYPMPGRNYALSLLWRF